MEKIFSFFKRRWWSFVPLCVCVCVWILSYLTKTTGGSYEAWIGMNGQNDIINDPIIFFLFFFTPSTLILLFVRKEIIKSWSLFAIIYVFVGILFIIKQNENIGAWGSSTSFFPGFFGLSLSLVTVLWAIIHTLILRHAEKKAIKIENVPPTSKI